MSRLAGRAGLQERLPEGRGIRDIDVELVAVLPRVAGAGDDDVCLTERAVGAGVVLEVGERRHLEGVGNDLPGRGTLHGDEHDLVGEVGELHVEARTAVLQRAHHHVAVAGVGDHEVRALREVVDDEVVEDAAALLEDERVLRPPERHRRDEAGEGVVEEGRRIRAGHTDLGHVRDVEEARGGAHGVVLGQV